MAAPANLDDFKARIARQQGELPPRLRQIAEFALRHPGEVALGTAAAIAARAGVQPSAIVRFAHALGFAGFSALQQLFRAHLLTGASSSYRERIATLRRSANGGSGDDPAGVLSRFVSHGVAALEHLHETTPPAALARGVRLLARAERIHVFAQGRAFPVAFYLHYALCRLDLRANLVDGIGGTAQLQARTASRRDALIAISFATYSPEVVALTEQLAARGVPVLAITDGPLSPIARPAAVSFELHEDEGQSFRSLVAPMCLAQSLVVALGHRLTAAPRRKNGR